VQGFAQVKKCDFYFWNRLETVTATTTTSGNTGRNFSSESNQSFSTANAVMKNIPRTVKLENHEPRLSIVTRFLRFASAPILALTIAKNTGYIATIMLKTSQLISGNLNDAITSNVEMPKERMRISTDEILCK
jgi:hypothetical protein